LNEKREWKKRNGKLSDIFQDLDYRLKNFITNRLKWYNFMPIQEKVIPKIKEGKDVLVIAPTASGKTEAVFIPIFDDILKNSLEPLTVLYISPLKALINDMYERLEKWCEILNATVTKWHGDVAPSEKQKFVKEPTNILMITPESLEVILINRNTESKKKIFQNLEYVVVDEIHYFAASDRGIQLNSLLNRLKRYIPHDIQKIGLSATVGNPKFVLKWLTEDKNAEIVTDDTQRLPQYKVICEQDYAILKTLKKYRDKKILFFLHSRRDAEEYHNLLKRHLKPENILIHHSSIDKEIREESEESFKLVKNGIMVSTSTLELGIDVGDISIVAQKNPPVQVTSFFQRVGRSGRRGNPMRTIIFCDSDINIFITLAEICLLEEGKLEEIKIPEKPKDIYFHQILSAVFEYGKITKKDLFFLLNNSHVFSSIEKEEYKQLIKDMIEKEFLEEYGGYLSLGYNFEKEFGKRKFIDFYTVFPPNYEFTVKEGLKHIGTLDAFFVINYLTEWSEFVLGGQTWKVIEIEYDRFTVKVEKTKKGGEPPQWYSEGGVMDYLVTRKIYHILLNDFNSENLRYFDDKSKGIVKEFQEEASKSGFEHGKIPVEFDEKEKRVFMYTFGGLRVNALISSIFKVYYDVYSIQDSSYHTSFKFHDDFGLANIANIADDIEEILKDEDLEAYIFEKTKKFVKSKFIKYLPEKDQIELKTEILFNKEGLIDLFQKNSLKIISAASFKEW
jgi:ATP-dependent Lhr-like helicase